MRCPLVSIYLEYSRQTASERASTGTHPYSMRRQGIDSEHVNLSTIVHWQNSVSVFRDAHVKVGQKIQHQAAKQLSNVASWVLHHSVISEGVGYHPRKLISTLPCTSRTLSERRSASRLAKQCDTKECKVISKPMSEMPLYEQSRKRAKFQANNDGLNVVRCNQLRCSFCNGVENCLRVGSRNVRLQERSN